MNLTTVEIPWALVATSYTIFRSHKLDVMYGQSLVIQVIAVGSLEHLPSSLWTYVDLATNSATVGKC